MIYFERVRRSEKFLRDRVTKDFMAIESCDRDNEERVQVVLTGKASPMQGKEEVSVAYIPPWSKRLKQESMKALTGGPYSTSKPLKGQGSI